MACFMDDFEACIAHLRLPISHRRATRTTNLLERLFVEERRRPAEQQGRPDRGWPARHRGDLPKPRLRSGVLPPALSPAATILQPQLRQQLQPPPESIGFGWQFRPSRQTQVSPDTGRSFDNARSAGGSTVRCIR